MLHRSVKGRNSERILDKQHKKLVRRPVTMSIDIDDCKIGTFAYGVTGSKYKGKIGWITNVGNVTKRVTIQYSDNRKQAWALRNIRFAYAEEIDETIKTSAPYLDFVRENGTRLTGLYALFAIQVCGTFDSRLRENSGISDNSRVTLSNN